MRCHTTPCVVCFSPITASRSSATHRYASYETGRLHWETARCFGVIVMPRQSHCEYPQSWHRMQPDS